MARREEETDFPQHDISRCVQRRAIEKIQDRLTEGDKMMAEHTVVLRQNTAAVERLTLAVEKQKAEAAKPNAIGQQILASLISWGVPAVIVTLILAAVKTGVIK